MPSPSLVLGPQALDSVRRYTVGPLKGPDGNPIVGSPWNVALAGTEPLACRVWRGEGSAALATPTATWKDPAAGTVTLSITPADLTGLPPGRYRIELVATIDGEPLACLAPDAVIDLADAPGSAAAAGRLVSMEEARAALGEPIASRGDLPDLVAAAGDWAELYCNRPFALAAEIADLDGTGTPSLFLPRTPVASVDQVIIREPSASADLPLDNTAGKAWSFDPATGELRRGDGRGPREHAWPWPRGFRNISVSYTGGFDPIPTTVRRAVLALARHLAGQVDPEAGIKRLKIRDYEEERAYLPTEVDLPPAARALLSRFKQVTLA